MLKLKKMLKLKNMKVILIAFLICLPLLHSQAQTKAILIDQAKDYRAEGYKLQSMGELSKALSFYQKAIELYPTYTQAYNDIGVIFESQGQISEAKRYYQKALELNPNFMPAHTNLAFLYEKVGDVKKATEHWKSRYLQGKKGDYWREVARQHLLKLGTYPEIRKEIMEAKAADLSKQLAYQREQKRLEVLEEARLYFRLGEKSFQERDYSGAIEEFKKVLSLDPKDPELKEKTRTMMKKARDLYLRQSAFVNTKDALKYIENNDYLSAAERLKSALTAVFRISQKELSKDDK
ncbi:MAG: tetratricopeptide repeat protein [Candidatus Omnitrophica bacterium]|nr:tetratricopeptide repeat protein [Candidatus Omnitrophota bacterium]